MNDLRCFSVIEIRFKAMPRDRLPSKLKASFDRHHETVRDLSFVSGTLFVCRCGRSGRRWWNHEMDRKSVEVPEKPSIYIWQDFGGQREHPFDALRIPHPVNILLSLLSTNGWFIYWPLRVASQSKVIMENAENFWGAAIFKLTYEPWLV